MSALTALEQALEDRWEALWARLLDKEPVELLDALREECDSNALVCAEGRKMAPNVYAVELDRAVHDELARRGSRVDQALTDSLARHGEQRGYTWPGPLTVHVTRSSHVPNGRYRVASAVMSHVSADGIPDPGSG
ncbi:DUF3662 domain-containing protein [Streptomyces sp. DH24]|uniref:DUF3662 domain-containing protein n=1 Tax=Streptomyces sp. DH24 TaxID=3040123 RepID=UPI0024433F68|nr:DUF3662 domain-containing protein [Streptomyces sp. DH24]MDG9719526.1 DUF3662 domain-containing protein [Streptomyces sp. DH24]